MEPKSRPWLREYFAVSSPNGLSYLGGDGAAWSPAERAFWACAVLACLAYCTATVADSLVDWGGKKYVVRVESFAYPAQVK